MKLSRKPLSVLLCLALLCTLFPASACSDEPTDGGQGVEIPSPPVNLEVPEVTNASEDLGDAQNPNVPGDPEALVIPGNPDDAGDLQDSGGSQNPNVPASSDGPNDTDDPTSPANPDDTGDPDDSDDPDNPDDPEPPDDADDPDDLLPPPEAPAPAWDETLCTHTTADCELAPDCDAPDCPHVVADVHGLPVPCCALGEWLLAQNDTPPQAETRLLRATAPVRVDLSAGDLNIYRSGSYIVQGGGATAKITVQPNRVVSLQLQGVTAQSLALLNGATANIAYTGRESTLDTLSASGGAAVLLGGGSLVCAAVSGDVRMEGGSVKAPAGSSANGRQLYAFAGATGTVSATVDGAAVSGYTKPCSDGSAYLWLGAPPLGGQYTATVSGTELVVSSQPPAPVPSADYDLAASPPSFAAQADTAYRIFASGGAVAQTLDVSATGVTLTLDALTAANLDGVSVSGLQPYRLALQGDSTLGAVRATGALTVSGDGSLCVGALEAASLAISGGSALRFDSAAGGWLSALHALPLSGNLDTAQRATLDGQPLPLIYRSADPATLYLPAPPAGMQYQAELTTAGPRLTTVPVGTQEPTVLTLSDSPLTITQNGAYILRGQPDGFSAGALHIADGVDATLRLEDANLSAAAAVTIGAGARVTLLVSAHGKANWWRGPCTVAPGATLTARGDGALMLGSLSASGATLRLQCNVTLGAGTTAGDRVATVLAVTDNGGAPLANASITLKLGDTAPFAAYTDRDGRVFVWGDSALTGVDVAVLSSEGTTAAIVQSGTGAPQALPVISAIWASAYGSVLCTIENAQPEWTCGMQYLLGVGPRDMPDAYVPEASTVGALNGEFVIPGLQVGQWVTCRVFVSKTPGATLSAQTQDAFAFSQKLSFQVQSVLPPFTLPAQSKTYDAKPFHLRSSLVPGGARVFYLQDGAYLPGPPTDAGDYVIRVIISGGGAYQPGVYDSPLRVKKLVIYIVPNSYSKYEGEDDPSDGEFLFTYHPELLNDDIIDGFLGREDGEEPGNYCYTVDWLEAPENYDLRLDPNATLFNIARAPHKGEYDPLARIDPVHRILRFSTGETLDLIIQTVERLTISHQGYGSLITDTQTGQARPFTPDLTLRQGVDEALLTLEAEPELRDDGGYETDFYGNPILRSRTLTLSFFQLTKLTEQHIAHVLFRLDDTALLLSVAELAGPELRDYVKQQGLGLRGGQVQVVLEPVDTTAALLPGEESAQELAALGVRLIRARVEYVQDENRLDLTPYLRQTALLKDASGLLEAEAERPAAADEQVLQGDLPARDTEEILREQQALEQTAAERIARQGDTLARYAALVEPQRSMLVVPYADSERADAPYAAMLRSAPYLRCDYARNGLYGFARQAADAGR